MNSNFKIETNNVRNVVVEWGDKNFVSVVEWPNRDGFDINFDTGLQLSLSKTQFFALLPPHSYGIMKLPATNPAL